jgi:hypothetical protein
MPKKKQPDLTSDEQKRRFEELSRQVGATTSEEDLRKTVRRIARTEGKEMRKRTKKQ